MSKFTLPFVLVVALGLAACRPETPLGGPPTPAEAILVTEPAAEILAPGTTINLVESPARKMTGAVDAGESLSYTLVVAEGATAVLAISTPLDELAFSLIPPDGATLEGEATAVKAYTGTLPVAGEYTLEIANGAGESGTFVMDVRIDLGMEPNAP